MNKHLDKINNILYKLTFFPFIFQLHLHLFFSPSLNDFNNTTWIIHNLWGIATTWMYEFNRYVTFKFIIPYEQLATRRNSWILKFLISPFRFLSWIWNEHLHRSITITYRDLRRGYVTNGGCSHGLMWRWKRKQHIMDYQKGRRRYNICNFYFAPSFYILSNIYSTWYYWELT